MVELRADPSWRLSGLGAELPPTHVSAGTHPPGDISPLHQEFANLELARPLGYYERRIEAIGFTGMNRVLDVACGIGHWSLALALHNDEVHGIDRAEERLALAELIARRHDRTNLHFTHGDAEELPFADGWFDALFCYSVLMWLDREEAFAEFRRVLKPGGQLYVCANGLGWTLYLAVGRGLYRTAWRTIRLTLPGELPAGMVNLVRPHPDGSRRTDTVRDVFLTRRRVVALTAANGFRIDAWGGEGMLRAPDRAGAAVAPVYRSRFLGAQSVWEMLATRLETRELDNGAAPAAADPEELVRGAQEFDSPRRLAPAAVTAVGSPEEDESAAEPARYTPDPLPEVTDRECDARLAALAARIVEGRTSEGDQVEALIRFCQDAIYHNPVTQPSLALHPYKVLCLREGRCGHVAALLATLLRAAGFSARTRQLRAHVIAEVFLSGEWRIADADAFKNGIIPRGDDGLLLTFRELEQDPYRIDRYQPSGFWMQPGTHYVRNVAGVPVTGYVDALPPERRGFLSNHYAWWIERRYPPSIPVPDRIDSRVSQGKVRLSWSPSFDPDDDLRGYTVRVGTTSRGWSFDAAVYDLLTAQTGTEVAVLETPDAWIDVTIERPGTYVWSVSAFDAHRELEPETFYWSSDESTLEVR